MNIINFVTKPLPWFMAILLAAFVAGCGGGGGGGSGADITAPTVISTAPANAATGIALTANITATFSKAMNAATITTATFTLKQGGTVVPGAVTYTGTTATFNPTSNLVAGLSYVATITTGVKDLAGNALTVKKTWSFLTADTSQPSVSSTVPANLATLVPLNANITATFSKAMNPLTISTTTFTLKQGGTAIPGKVTSPSTTTAAFRPTSNLLAGLVYTATITTGVKDLAGNAMAVAKVWTFTTNAGATLTGTAPLDLGTAGNYAILSKAGVSTVPASLVTGNIGVSPVARTYLTGWSQTYDVTDTYATSDQVVAPGKLYAADNVGGTTSTDLGTAVLDMGTAYAAGNALPAAGGGLVTACPGAGIMSGITIAAGVYTCANAVTIPASITLNGSATDVWVFQFAQTLTQASATQVILTGGALPQNVFWVVTGAVDIGTTALMQGVILSATNINLRTGATVNGRLLAQTAVTLDQNTVTQP